MLTVLASLILALLILSHFRSLGIRERKSARAVLRLAQQFPGDPGAMSPLFLNYLLIAPGESFFMAANEPHAYVAGEIIECMACSDNVVRGNTSPMTRSIVDRQRT